MLVSGVNLTVMSPKNAEQIWLATALVFWLFLNGRKRAERTARGLKLNNTSQIIPDDWDNTVSYTVSLHIIVSDDVRMTAMDLGFQAWDSA